MSKKRLYKNIDFSSLAKSHEILGIKSCMSRDALYTVLDRLWQVKALIMTKFMERTVPIGVYAPKQRIGNRPIIIIISMISSVINIINIISTVICISNSILFNSSLSTVSFIRICNCTCNCTCNMNDRAG